MGGRILRRLLIAALLSSTAIIAPSRADAGPVVTFIGGALNALGAATYMAAGASVGAWTLGFNAASWLAGGSIAARMTLAFGFSAAAKSLLRRDIPAPKMAPIDIKANFAQDVAFMRHVYGETRAGGPFAFSAFSKKGVASLGMEAKARRHYGVILAAHQIEGVVAHYLNDDEVSTDSTGWVTTAPMEGYCRIRVYDGTQAAPDPFWRGLFPEVTDNDIFAGLSYAALYAKRPKPEDVSDIYDTSREWSYAPVIRGENRILDPRTGQRGWTRNAALVAADVITRIYGKAVKWAEVAEQADICDQVVVNRDGEGQPRWSIDTTISCDMTLDDALSHLMLACDGFWYEHPTGEIGFKVGCYEAPTVTLTDADFVSVSLPNRTTGVDDPHSYAMRYTDPSREYAQEVCGAVIAGDNPAGGKSEQECYGITSHNQAWRCAYRMATVAKAEWRMTATLKYSGRRLLGQRFFRATISEVGIDAVFEISTLARDAGGMTWSVEAVSVEPDDFLPDALTLEPPPQIRETIAEDGSVDAPAALAGQVVPGTGGVAQINWTWPLQDDTLRPRLRMRQNGGDWNEVTLSPLVSSYLLSGLVDGATYEAQVRNVTGGGRVSAWVPDVPISVIAIADTAPPAAMRYFAALQSGSSVALSWTAPNSANYRGARIYRATGSTSFAAATLIASEAGAANMADDRLDASPGVGAHSYWIEPINGSGIGGPVSGPQTVTIS